MYSWLEMFWSWLTPTSGGSEIPPGMEKIELYYTIPILIPQNSITVFKPEINKSYELKLIGGGLIN